VKTYIIAVFLLLACFGLKGQQRDLYFYLEHAQKNSPLINKDINENQIVKLDLKLVNSILSKPEINLVSGIMFAPIISHDNNSNHFELVSDGANDYIGHDLALTDGGQYQALVSMKQPLLGGPKYKFYANKADISGQISKNNIALTIHELEQVVGYQYILCLKSRKQTDNSLTLLKALEDQSKTMKKLVENAIYKQTDLMILEIEVQNFRTEYKRFKAEYITNLYDLNIICGISDTNRVDLQDINFEIKPENTGVSNFLTSYKLDSLNINADQAINELKYKPQLDLFADAGLNAAYIPYPSRLGFSTGLTFTWNIFDGRQRHIQKEKSAISLQTIEFEKKNFMTQNDIGKKKILNQIKDIDQRIDIIDQQSVQYRSLYDAYSQELSQGEVSVMDFKNLVKDIAAKKQEMLQLRMEKQFLINSFNYLNY
jgi:Outer membrane efflux protein